MELSDKDKGLILDTKRNIRQITSEISSLISDIHKNLAHVILLDEDGKSHNVYFSQIVGEHSTFETDGESVHVAGEDAGRYTYFKIGDKFRKYF